MNEFEYVLALFISKVIAEDMSDKLRQLRFEALAVLRQHLAYYRETGIREDILYAIAEKKCNLIMTATSKAEIDKILKPKCPHFDGNKFVPDKYDIPEEEMIGWSQASLKAPLNEAGFKRYMELFEQIFPIEYKSLFGTGSA